MNGIKTLVDQSGLAWEEKGPQHTSLCCLSKGSQAYVKVLLSGAEYPRRLTLGRCSALPEQAGLLSSGPGDESQEILGG